MYEMKSFPKQRVSDYLTPKICGINSANDFLKRFEKL